MLDKAKISTQNSNELPAHGSGSTLPTKPQKRGTTIMMKARIQATETEMAILRLIIRQARGTPIGKKMLWHLLEHSRNLTRPVSLTIKIKRGEYSPQKLLTIHTAVSCLIESPGNINLILSLTKFKLRFSQTFTLSENKLPASCTFRLAREQALRDPKKLPATNAWESIDLSQHGCG